MLTEEQLRTCFERRYSTGNVLGLDQVFARAEDGRYESTMLQRAWEMFCATVRQAHDLLPDHLGPFDPELAQQLRDTCMLLGAQDLPDSNEALWANAGSVLERAVLTAVNEKQPGQG